jgi:hypothetical protein
MTGRFRDPAAEGAAAARDDNHYAARAPKGVRARQAATWISSADARERSALDALFGIVRSAYTELYAETKGGTESTAIREAAQRISATIADALEIRAEEVEEGGDGEIARRIRNIADWARKAHAMAIGPA